MTYAKFINATQIEYAPKSVTYNGRFIINPPPDILIDLGYLPVIKADMPVEENCCFTPYYEVENNNILQKWERREIEEQPEIIIDKTTSNNTFEDVRETKIKTMSEVCNQTIVNGIDVTLSDGISHHFELTTEEQLNLISLKEMIAQGATSIPYHAKDELCKFYSVEDMTTIIETATQFKTYHTSYFNSLKNYINSMATIEEIGAVEYGIDIPAEYQSDVLKELVVNGKN